MEKVYEEHPGPFARFAENVFGIDEKNTVNAAREGVAEYKNWLKKINAPNTYFDIGNNDFADSGLRHVAETACRIYGGSVGKLKKFNSEQAYELLQTGKISY
jgi:alcohol dehydrogenase YqhD (iron-dependent ADH family)